MAVALNRLRRALSGAVLLLVAGAPLASTEILADPTRPATAAFAAADTPQAGAADGQLQSVLIKPGRKPKALISGEWLEQGQLYNGSRLVKVTAESVILQPVHGGSGTSGQAASVERRILRLNPDAMKATPARATTKRSTDKK